MSDIIREAHRGEKSGKSGEFMKKIKSFFKKMFSWLDNEDMLDLEIKINRIESRMLQIIEDKNRKREIDLFPVFEDNDDDFYRKFINELLEHTMDRRVAGSSHHNKEIADHYKKRFSRIINRMIDKRLLISDFEKNVRGKTSNEEMIFSRYVLGNIYSKQDVRKAIAEVLDFDYNELWY